MNIFVGISVIFFLLLSALFVAVFRRLAAAEKPPAGEEWIAQLFAERYRPMERLLDPAERSALKSHPAATRRMLRQLRSARIRIFRGYLGCLSSDYRRVSTAIRLLMVHSTVDRPDLAGLLLRQHLFFTFHLLLAQFRLLLYSAGFGRVEAGPLVAVLDGMRIELHSLAQAASQAAAA